MVIRFNPAGHVQWVFGRRQESADGAKPWEHVTPPLPARDGMFRQPTDVAWDSKGNIYITDGYIDSRVAKYDNRGNWVKQWGTKGTGPSQFNTPHSIVIDRDDNIYVGDRGNRRVQVFDTDGNFKKMWTVDVEPDYSTRSVNGSTPAAGSIQGVGAPNSLCIPPGQNAVMFLGESTWPGRVFKLGMDGKVIGVIGKSGRNMKEFSGAHALACPTENEIYVAESSNWRVQKIVLHPTKATASR
jgi:outer membrane protein assembly factor BamB